MEASVRPSPFSSAGIDPHVDLVLDYLDGGDLLSFISEKQGLSMLDDSVFLIVAHLQSR